ncbi:unknown [[Mannheimia] succiniciproducens MBEL55E]|uniref:Uncharacterized protein n=1 Tax=Mannheimia succiniciproducens (strain KCTC 0769BP / MBEL55E) TaxID=221988 RepID=Q65RV3_MANSM|nr:unknown [[Mannheimia] succiniciproducens MBEL55E]
MLIYKPSLLKCGRFFENFFSSHKISKNFTALLILSLWKIFLN